MNCWRVFHPSYVKASLSSLQSPAIQCTLLFIFTPCSHWEVPTPVMTKRPVLTSVCWEVFPRCGFTFHVGGASMKSYLSIYNLHRLVFVTSIHLSGMKLFFLVLFCGNTFLCTFELRFPFSVLILPGLCQSTSSKIFSHLQRFLLLFSKGMIDFFLNQSFIGSRNFREDEETAVHALSGIIFKSFGVS